jgi:hypothetical protein
MNFFIPCAQAQPAAPARAQAAAVARRPHLSRPFGWEVVNLSSFLFSSPSFPLPVSGGNVAINGRVMTPPAALPSPRRLLLSPLPLYKNRWKPLLLSLPHNRTRHPLPPSPWVHRRSSPFIAGARPRRSSPMLADHRRRAPAPLPLLGQPPLPSYSISCAQARTLGRRNHFLYFGPYV